MRRPRIAVLLVLLAPACGVFGGDDPEDTDAPVTSDGATQPTGGVACNVDADCPLPSTCELVACTDGLCVLDLRPAGDVVDDEIGDCRNLVCDADGIANPQADPDDLPDDGIACTDDVCADDGPANLPRAPGSACNDTFVCHADRTCQPCPERDGCDDTSAAEPNESQSQAATLAPQRDDADPVYLCEALGGPADVDWFMFPTVDTSLGAVAPAVDATPDIVVCMYFQCQAGGTNLACPAGTTAAVAPLGQQGCCGPGSFAPTIDCNGFDEDATVWLEIRHTPGSTAECLNYQLGYEY